MPNPPFVWIWKDKAKPTTESLRSFRKAAQDFNNKLIEQGLSERERLPLVYNYLYEIGLAQSGIGTLESYVLPEILDYAMKNCFLGIKIERKPGPPRIFFVKKNTEE